MRLVASDLACVRGGREVFSGVSLAVGAGEGLVISGANGAGKSSLLRLIAGLVRPAAGRLTLEGGDTELTIAEQAHYLGHLDALKPALSVSENLVFWTRFLGGGEATAARPALAAVGLDRIASLPAAYLSAGQRRRLSIARLIAVRRPIWLLDEPTSALDASAQTTLASLMAQHRAGGGLILAAVHGPIGLERPAELRLGPPLAGSAESSLPTASPSSPFPLTKAGGHGPSGEHSAGAKGATPAPTPSPQGGGEKKGPAPEHSP